MSGILPQQTDSERARSWRTGACRDAIAGIATAQVALFRNGTTLPSLDVAGSGVWNCPPEVEKTPRRLHIVLEGAFQFEAEI